MNSSQALEFEEASRLRDEIKRLQTVELTLADDPFARQSEVERLSGEALLRAKTDAVDDAFLSAVRDGAEDTASPSRGPKHQKTSRGKMRRAPRPNAPKTFGSRSR